MRAWGRLSLVIALVALGTAGADARKRAAPKAPKQPPQLRPLGQYHNWFGTRDYPQDAAIKRQEGTTGFELEIDTNGLPIDCKIIKTSGSDSLDNRTCTIMLSRARFRPKLDAKGNAVPTVFRHAMIWKLPVRKQEKTTDRSFDARSIIAANGDVTACTLSGAGASKMATSGGNCGPFGNKEFLQANMGDDYKKARSVNVKMSVLFATSVPVDPTAILQKTLAKASIDISPAGDMSNCTSLLKMDVLGKSLNLCDLIRADPPRFPAAAAARRGTISLDLLAYKN